ncbi:hypothetical protein Ahy_A05g023933 isoform A [Arachis hypogaea]|uniref:Protein FAR1-RELATED SEQUENCE n=1 Tax=Arachis hypogaea TaxID=3818 RepID=A0A445D4X7_ARAHY|nr:hypothetical protein Ahy_A05g023933 isoform A [Arachis hypogaea]
MRITQRSESMHAFSNKFIMQNNSLIQFVKQYDNCLGSREQRERKLDPANFHTVIPYAAKSSIEAQFQQVYTHQKFREVQTQFRGKVNCITISTDSALGYSVYEVIEQVSNSTFNKFAVTYDSVATQCLLFESRGILCSHTLNVLSFERVNKVLARYTLERWSKNVKGRHTHIKSSHDELVLEQEARELKELTAILHSDYDNVVVEMQELKAKRKGTFLLRVLPGFPLRRRSVLFASEFIVFVSFFQDPPTSGPATSSPPPFSGPPPKKQKTSQELAGFNDKDFDALGWIEQHILPQTFISTDDVSMEHHFQYMARSCVRMASLHAAIAREFKKSPLGATSSRLERTQSELDRISQMKAARITELEASLEKEKTKATAAVAAAKTSEEMAKAATENYTRLYTELVETKEELQSAQDKFCELEGHVAKGMDAMFENLKAQVRVLAPDLDLSLFSTDNVVVEGKIVPAPSEDEVPMSDPKAPVENPTSPLVGDRSGRDDVAVDAVPISMFPPQPAVDVESGKDLDPL